MKKIILASNSPRRKEILQNRGIEFEIVTAECKEINSKHYDDKNIIYNSQIKASATANKLTDKNVIIIAADTVVVLNSVCLVKPQNKIEALFMLKKLSGKTHTVITSHTILDPSTEREVTKLSKSFVTFRKLNLFEIIKYILEKKPARCRFFSFICYIFQ